MHKNKLQPFTSRLTIRPFDVIYYQNGPEIQQGVVMATEPTIGACRIIRESGTITRLGFLATVPEESILAGHSLLPIQKIEDGLAAQFGGELGRATARIMMLEAVLHKSVTLSFTH